MLLLPSPKYPPNNTLEFNIYVYINIRTLLYIERNLSYIVVYRISWGLCYGFFPSHKLACNSPQAHNSKKQVFLFLLSMKE